MREAVPFEMWRERERERERERRDGYDKEMCMHRNAQILSTKMMRTMNQECGWRC